MHASSSLDHQAGRGDVISGDHRAQDVDIDLAAARIDIAEDSEAQVAVGQRD